MRHLAATLAVIGALLVFAGPVACSKPGRVLVDAGGDSSTPPVSEIPSPTAVEEAHEAYGEFEPFEVNGTGDDEIPLPAFPAGTRAFLLTLTYAGPSDSQPREPLGIEEYSHRPSGAYVCRRGWGIPSRAERRNPPGMGIRVCRVWPCELECDRPTLAGRTIVRPLWEVGQDPVPYSGTSMYDRRAGHGRSDPPLEGGGKLEVLADGSWTLSVHPVSAAREMSAVTTGMGDDVLLYDGGPADWRLEGGVDDCWWVFDPWDYPTDYSWGDPFESGTHSIGAGPLVVVVRAEQAWSITIE